MSDPINPNHYRAGLIQPVDFIIDQDFGFLAASVIKYLCRYRGTKKPVEDLEKAKWYLARLIREEQRGGDTTGDFIDADLGPDI